VGLAAASPEIGINITSAIRRVGDTGLGAMLGSNVLAIPVMVLVAYIATREQRIGGHEGHAKHLSRHLLHVDHQAVTVQALPYLGIVAVFALLNPAGILARAAARGRLESAPRLSGLPASGPPARPAGG
jgi:cation:H+ antiporter